MLQDPGSRHGTLLGHVADNKESDPGLLGQAQQDSCGLPDLGNTARRRLDAGIIHGLDGVNDHQIRLFPGQDLCDGIQFGLAQETGIVPEGADPVGPQFDLMQGFLTGDIEDPVPGGRYIGRRLQQQGGFADAGVAADQDQGAFDDSPAQDPVQFPEPGGETDFPAFLHCGEAYRHPFLTDPGRPAWRTAGPGHFDRFLHHGVPGPAGRTLAGPFGGFIPAFLAEEGSLFLTRGHRTPPPRPLPPWPGRSFCPLR